MIACIVIDVHTMEPQMFAPDPHQTIEWDEAVADITRNAIEASGFVYILFETDSKKQQIITTGDVVVTRDMENFDPRDYL